MDIEMQNDQRFNVRLCFGIAKDIDFKGQNIITYFTLHSIIPAFSYTFLMVYFRNVLCIEILM